MARKQSIRACCQYEYVIRNSLSGRCRNDMVVRVDGYDPSVKMIFKSTQRSVGILKGQLVSSDGFLPSKLEAAYPVLRVKIQILHFPMLKETRQAHTVVCEMRFLPNDHNFVFTPLCIHLEKLLATTVSGEFN